MRNMVDEIAPFGRTAGANDMASLPRTAADRVSVLLAISDPVVREVIALALEPLCVDCSVADDGYDSIERVGGAPVDLVIVSARLPRVAGLQFVEHLRSDPRWRECVVIVLTECDADESLAAAYAVGADDVLAQPLSIVELRSRVQRRLRTSRAAAACR